MRVRTKERHKSGQKQKKSQHESKFLLSPERVVKQHFWLLTANIESAETFVFQNLICQVPALSLEGIQPEVHQVISFSSEH